MISLGVLKMSIDLINRTHDQLDQAIALAEKLNRQKYYLVDLLIRDKSQSTTVIINQYLDWLEKDERK
jgi:hypothetical protein